MKFPYKFDFKQYYQIKEEVEWSEEYYTDSDLETLKDDLGITLEYRLVNKCKTFFKKKV